VGEVLPQPVPWHILPVEMIGVFKAIYAEHHSDVLIKSCQPLPGLLGAQGCVGVDLYVHTGPTLDHPFHYAGQVGMRKGVTGVATDVHHADVGELIQITDEAIKWVGPIDGGQQGILVLHSPAVPVPVAVPTECVAHRGEIQVQMSELTNGLIHGVGHTRIY